MTTDERSTDDLLAILLADPATTALGEGPAYTFRSGTQGNQNSKTLTILKTQYAELHDRCNWDQFQKFVGQHECICLNQSLLLSKSRLTTTSGSLLLGTVYISSTEATSPDALKEAVGPIVDYYYNHYTTDDPMAKKRVDIWESATNWFPLVMEYEMWELVCLMSCHDIHPDMGVWVASHAQEVMLVSQSSFLDRGAAFAEALSVKSTCKVQHLVLDTDELDWEGSFKAAIEQCASLKLIFFRSNNEDSMDACIKAAADNTNLEEVHVHGKGPQPTSLGDKWLDWCKMLLVCPNLKAIRYEIALDENNGGGGDDKAIQTKRSKELLEAARRSKILGSFNIYTKHIDTATWKEDINKILKLNSMRSKMLDSAKSLQPHNIEESGPVLFKMLSHEKIQGNPEMTYDLIKTVRESVILLHKTA